MALFTSQRLIQLHAISLFILAYYLITAPEAITTSSMVFMLGEAMHIVRYLHRIWTPKTSC